MAAENHHPDTEELPHPQTTKKISVDAENFALSCPVCGLANRPGELACSRCGTILTNSGRTRALKPDEEPTAQAVWPTGDVIVSAQEPLVLEVNDQELAIPVTEVVTLGRNSDVPGEPGPDIDLTPYGAGNMGVSRLHIKIKRKNNLIYVADTVSTNGTLLNGRRLIPNAERLLRNGDELQLGRLKVKVRF